MNYDERKLPSLLLGILCKMSKGVSRTNLVNLTYLIDEANYRLKEETITGLTYKRDSYGPNAASNEIATVLEGLVRQGTLTVNRSPQTESGNPRSIYRVKGDFDIDTLDLTPDEWLSIQSAVHRHGRMSVSEITYASKQTVPFKNASQYEVLNLKRDWSLTITDEDIAKDPFLAETVEALKDDTGEYISLEELKREKVGRRNLG